MCREVTVVDLVVSLSFSEVAGFQVSRGLLVDNKILHCSTEEPRRYVSINKSALVQYHVSTARPF